ncbi:MAG: hypothetical protein AVDCRST_MAG93-8177, partial [uncultured Chloroflexia bacterium]
DGQRATGLPARSASFNGHQQKRPEVGPSRVCRRGSNSTLANSTRGL